MSYDTVLMVAPLDYTLIYHCCHLDDKTWPPPSCSYLLLISKENKSITIKAFDGDPPNRYSLSLKFLPSSAEPSAQKRPSRKKASPLRGGRFFSTRLGKGSYCSQLSSTAPETPDLSWGFDLATSSCLALTGQGCSREGEEKGRGAARSKDPPLGTAPRS